MDKRIQSIFKDLLEKGYFLQIIWVDNTCLLLEEPASYQF